MGVCDCFMMISGQKRKKKNTPVNLEDSIYSKGAQDVYPAENKLGFLTFNREVIGCSMGTKEYAATQIQTAFRSYKARKTLHISRLQPLINVDALTKQASTTLERLHFWSKIQAEIGSRRLCISSEGRMRQMKFEDRLKVESKLHELEMKWLGGLETIEENMLKMQGIEKASNKRERALAYAFCHQWRPNSCRYFGQAYYDLSKESWGWNWINQWIAVYRLEDHVVVRPVVSPRSRPQKNIQQ